MAGRLHVAQHARWTVGELIEICRNLAEICRQDQRPGPGKAGSPGQARTTTGQRRLVEPNSRLCDILRLLLAVRIEDLGLAGAIHGRQVIVGANAGALARRVYTVQPLRRNDCG